MFTLTPTRKHEMGRPRIRWRIMYIESNLKWGRRDMHEKFDEETKREGAAWKSGRNGKLSKTSQINRIVRLGLD